MPSSDAIVPIGLDHVVLRVTDVERAIVFYRDVLGCAVERRLDQLGLTQLRAGHSLIDLLGIDSPLGLANPKADDDHAAGGVHEAEGITSDPEAKFAARNMDHFAIALSEFDETAIRGQLDRFGVAADETRRVYGAKGFGPSIYLRDPDGNTVELKGPSEPNSRLDPNESPKE
ncbi:MAG TPA: VOC family protein [Myxococcales bacterium]|nr:VOC family protein [Myxococcales bacterium]HIK86410.1 VOC family protein [Myxococcales bacterium]